MPWRQRPEKADLICLSFLGLVSVYALVIMPLRPVMITWTPHLLAIMGHRTGIVMTGALAATGDQWWWLVLIAASIMGIKFDWIYWWAGKLWGHDIIEIWSGKSARARRRNDRAVAFAQKYQVLAIMVTYLPIPVPGGVIYAALGAAGVRLRNFLAVTLASSAITASCYMFLGYQLGSGAVELVQQYSAWMNYLSIAILVSMLAIWWWNDHRKRRDANPDLPDQTGTGESAARSDLHDTHGKLGDHDDAETREPAGGAGSGLP